MDNITREQALKFVRQFSDTDLSRFGRCVKSCLECGKIFFAVKGQRCIDCALYRQRKLNREWMRKFYKAM